MVRRGGRRWARGGGVNIFILSRRFLVWFLELVGEEEVNRMDSD